MTTRWYGTVAAFVAVAAVSGCANASQPTETAAPSDSNVALATGVPVNVAATAPAPPPPTLSPPPTASVPTASVPTAPTQSGPPGGDQPGPDRQLYSKHAAQLRLDADLAGLHLPQGAVRQTGPLPKAVTQESSSIGMETAALDAWWSVPGTAVDVTGYVKSHPPTGFGVANSSFIVTLHGESMLQFVTVATKGPQTLYNAGIAQDGDRVDVRVELQVGYLPTRTAIETIPASVTSGVGVYQPPNQLLPANTTPAPRRTVALSAAGVRALADSFNTEDAQATGIAHSCPAADGEEAWFTLHYGGRTVVFDAAVGGCGGITVTANGIPQPELGLGDTSYAAVRKALHVTKAENPLLP